MQPPASPPPPGPRCYRSEPKTLPRNIDGWELGCLIDLAFRHGGDLKDGLVIELTPDEYGGLSGDKPGLAALCMGFAAADPSWEIVVLGSVARA